MTAVNAVLGRVGQWPPYAAHVEFEFWRDNADQQIYVQVCADGAVYRPFGANVDMVPYDWFMMQLKDVLISESDWRANCGNPFQSESYVE